MADKPQVVKLAQPGIDVKTAGDDKLVYNSNWPLLKIYKQGSVEFDSFPNNAPNFTNLPITSHDLGYFPMFWWFANMSADAWVSNAGTIENRSEFMGRVLNFPVITKDKFLYSYISQGNQSKVKFYYYIFALDLAQPYTAPQIRSGGVVGPRNTNTVFKLAKPGKDISSTNMEDYVVNSLARSPMVHAVVQSKVGNDATVPGGLGFTYYHNLGYVPLFFAYEKTGSAPNFVTGYDGYDLWYADGTGASGFKTDEQKIQFFNLNVGKEMSLVILKDPFNVDNIIEVTI